MKTIHLLLLLLFVCMGSPALMGEEKKEGLEAKELAVPLGQRLELINCDAKMYGEFYARFSGKSVSVSPDVRVLKSSLVVSGPLSSEDAARFIENQLLLEGCVIKEDGPRAVTIVRGTGPWKMPAQADKKPVPSRVPDPGAACVPEGQRLEFPSIGVLTCSGLIGMMSGKRILIAPGLSGVVVSAHADGPLTNAEAVGVLEKALLSKGVFLKEFAPFEVAVFSINQFAVEAQSPGRGVRIQRVRRVPAPVPETP